MLALLLAPFPSSAVSFRTAESKPNARGSVRTLTYIDANDVRRRLNAVDPNWGFHVFDSHWRHGIVEVRAELTVGGAMRSDYGAAEVNKPRSFDGDPQSVDLHAVKSASSDALKRCATMFGIGDYLREMPFSYTDKVQLNNGYVSYITKEGEAELKAKYDAVVSHERFIARYGQVVA
jgi:hypothetical protein